MSEATDGYSRDLLRRFSSGDIPLSPAPAVMEEEDSVELELSLGLPFESDWKEKRLFRSSSVANVLTYAAEEAPPEAKPAVPLMRTCSLPAETDEEVRKRKELQCLRRMEAKRKRSEKQRSRAEEREEESLKAKVENLSVGPGHSGTQSGQAAPFGMPIRAGPGANWAVAALSRQRSTGSQGSFSSGVSEALQVTLEVIISEKLGFNIPGRNGSQDPMSATSIRDRRRTTGKSVNSPTEQPSDPSKKSSTDNYTNNNNNSNNNSGTTETARNVMDSMPCVSTKGDGPNGKKIDGFLYRYKKGEEVRIVCVCHGKFLSPAEFVEHAGGGDVAHPLKHIVVNPTPSAYL
ncbi:Ninja-family protein AFP3 [Acorus calamus]|uniref:Ninja-family protein n=1 Tax=Acorus calamus TaxID=4465 RepID=A0AAV9EWQ6_ACOCL|nr:Ninja-family protein AFP3 [Acorus calamus]